MKRIKLLENYIELWENDMEFKEGIKWNTKTTQYDKKDDITYSTGTFNSVKNIERLKSGCSEKVKIDRGEPIIKKFYGEDSQNKMFQLLKDAEAMGLDEYELKKIFKERLTNTETNLLFKGILFNNSKIF